MGPLDFPAHLGSLGYEIGFKGGLGRMVFFSFYLTVRAAVNPRMTVFLFFLFIFLVGEVPRKRCDEILLGKVPREGEGKPLNVIRLDTS